MREYGCLGLADRGTGLYKCAILSGDAEIDALLVVEKAGVLANEILHFLIHFINAAEKQNAVTLFLREVVLDLHLVDLVEDMVHRIIDTNVEKIVAHLGRALGLCDLEYNQPYGGYREKG